MNDIDNFVNKIHLEEVGQFNILKQIPDNSVDAIVTDPPYGLKFMGKKWDYDVPTVECWKECLRVLKPGGYLLAFAGTRTQHRMAVRIEDAGFEIRDMIAWVYGCLSDDTEILTDSGWKKHNEINVNDNIFSLQNNKLIKNKVKHIYKYFVNEKLRNIKNQNTDQLLTLNHKSIIKGEIRKQIKGVRIPRMEEDYKYEIVGNLPRKFKLPLASIYDGKYSIGKDFAELIGWIISEGNYQGDSISIYQSSTNKTKVTRIKYILGRLHIKYSEYKRKRIWKYKDKEKKYTEHQFYIHTGDIKTKIKNIIPDKKLNYTLLELPYKEKERLIYGLCEGDGSKSKNGHYVTFYQKDLKQLEIFQILLHFTNKQGWINYKKYGCSIHYNNQTEIQGKHKKTFVNYNGLVWCIETEIGNFMARRNGKIFITGNSGFPKSLNIGKAIDKLQGNEREVVYDESRAKRLKNQTVNYESPNGMKSTNRNPNLSKGTSEWEGWGTALKPALEPITVARKPLSEKTVVENVLKWGTGGINIDECRVETLDKYSYPNGDGGNSFSVGEEPDGKRTEPVESNALGRFPANLILSFPENEYIMKEGINNEQKQKALKWIYENA